VRPENQGVFDYQHKQKENFPETFQAERGENTESQNLVIEQG
jgi:hypothetical protein